MFSTLGEKMISIAQFDLEKIIESTSYDINERKKTDYGQSNNCTGTERKSQKERQIVLKKGTFMDTEYLSILFSQEKIIKTWPTQNWNLIMIDQTEQFAIFQSKTSKSLSILNLDTDEWNEDNEGHLLYRSTDGFTITDNFNSFIHAFNA